MHDIHMHSFGFERNGRVRGAEKGRDGDSLERLIVASFKIIRRPKSVVPLDVLYGKRRQNRICLGVYGFGGR